MKLRKFNEKELDFNAMNEQTEVLKNALEAAPNAQILRTIMDFQEENGNFSYINPKGAPSDARIDYYYTPTYLCTALLMKAYLRGIPEGIQVAQLEDSLRRGLTASMGRKFDGHGFDGVDDAAKILKEGGSEIFVREHPDFHPAFTALYRKLMTYPVFVYGTLLKGRYNHYLLEEAGYAEFQGRATLHGYALYDLGSYPGIKPSPRGMVLGEVYKVDEETLRALDRLEGEGSLYRRVRSQVHAASGEWINVFVYVYMGQVNRENLIPLSQQPYGFQEERVWYVAYGSNLSYARFLCYIQGGTAPNGSEYEGCDDKGELFATCALKLPYERYYANSSGSWGGKGVAFLDVNRKQGETLGRAYLITRGQFEQVQSQEGGWYSRVEELPNLPIFQGIPAMTMTGDYRHAEQEPSEKYLEVIGRGENETKRLLESQERREEKDRVRREKMREKREAQTKLRSLKSGKWNH